MVGVVPQAAAVAVVEVIIVVVVVVVPPRKRWTQDTGEWMGVSTVEAGRQALERGEFRQAVWEATSIKDPPYKKKRK